VADVLVFLILSATALFGGSGPTEPSAANAMALLGTNGRTALVDQGGALQRQFQALGVPNMNVFTKLPSVQGYGSLISTIYDDSTGTHPQAALDPCRLADGTFSQLRLSAIAVASGQLSHNDIVTVPPAPNCRQAAPSATTHRYFGQLLHVATLSIHGRGGQPISAGPMDVTMIGATGAPVGPTLHESGANDVSITLPKHAPDAAGFEVTGTAVSIGDAKVTQVTPLTITYDVDSPMQEALDSSAWQLSDTVGTFSVFKAQSVKQSVWLTSPSNGTVSHVTD
jgi:hypothetical protein